MQIADGYRRFGYIAASLNQNVDRLKKMLRDQPPLGSKGPGRGVSNCSFGNMGNGGTKSKFRALQT